MTIEKKYPADAYQRARTKVQELRGFYAHLAIYLIFVPVFIFLNFMSGSYPWAIFPIAGWGLGVLGHAAGVYDWNPFFGRDWEEQKIRELMEREKAQMDNQNQ